MIPDLLDPPLMHPAAAEPAERHRADEFAASAATAHGLLLQNVETPLFKMWRAPTDPENRQIRSGG